MLLLGICKSASHFRQITTLASHHSHDLTVVNFPRITSFTAKRLFDLPNEFEVGFTVKLNLDSITDYTLNVMIFGNVFVVGRNKWDT